MIADFKEGKDHEASSLVASTSWKIKETDFLLEPSEEAQILSISWF